MNPFEALATVYGCYYGHRNAVVEAWEDPDRHEAGEPPKYIGCYRCGEMVRVDWAD